MNQLEFLHHRQLYLFGNPSEKRRSAAELYHHSVALCKQVISSCQFKAETSEMADVISDTANSVLLHLDNFQVQYSHKTWISKIFRNKFLDSVRARKRKGGYAVFSIDKNWESEEGGENTFDVCDDFYCPANRLHYQNLVEEVNMEAKKSLRRVQLDIWKMKWEEDLSNQEIARRLGKDKNYVAVNWMRAKEMIIKNLEAKGKYDEAWFIHNRGGRMAA